MSYCASYRNTASSSDALVCVPIRGGYWLAQEISISSEYNGPYITGHVWQGSFGFDVRALWDLVLPSWELTRVRSWDRLLVGSVGARGFHLWDTRVIWRSVDIYPVGQDRSDVRVREEITGWLLYGRTVLSPRGGFELEDYRRALDPSFGQVYGDYLDENSLPDGDFWRAFGRCLAGDPTGWTWFDHERTHGAPTTDRDEWAHETREACPQAETGYPALADPAAV